MSEQVGATDEVLPEYEPVPDDAMPREHLAALEAVLMVVDEPVPAAQLASVLGLPTGQVLELLGELAADYRGETGGRPRARERVVQGQGGGRRGGAGIVRGRELCVERARLS